MEDGTSRFFRVVGAHGLPLPLARPLEEVALISMVHLLPQPLTAPLVVSWPNWPRILTHRQPLLARKIIPMKQALPRTAIERLALVRARLIDTQLLRRLAVDGTFGWCDRSEEGRPGFSAFGWILHRALRSRCGGDGLAAWERAFL